VPAAVAANWYVAAGQSLQQVLNSALPGDVITLQAGATFTGNFKLPNKSGTGWITIQSSLLSALPPAGQRVNPSHAPYMPKLVSPNGSPALATAAGAHHYNIIGLELASAPGIYSIDVVQLGLGSETATSALPHSIILDRLYIHGDRKVGGKRGVALNSRSTTVTNSYISDFKSTVQDAQAICGWNGSGPFQITNNYLEASGENIMFGGAKPTIPYLVPSNIIIRKNHLFKPLSWKIGHPLYAGTAWLVKNNIELKNARAVTIDGNVFENNWAMGQNGTAILFTVRTQSGAVPWAVVDTVTFTNNIVRDVVGGINVLARDGTYGGATRNITIRNNVFERVNGRAFVQLLTDCQNITIDHNTVFQTGPIILMDGGGGISGLVYRNNISARGTYGILGSGKGEGSMALAYYAPGSIVRRNVIAGASSGIYPVDNYFPASIYDVKFVDAFAGNYALAPTSPYLGRGTDGKNLGADFAAVKLATAGVDSTP
jgi:hypothetical protein